MEPEMLVGVLAFAGVVITALAGLLVRERRRNGNPGHHLGLPPGCPYVQAGGKVALSDETLAVLTGGLESIRSEVAGVRSAQGKILDGMGKQETMLAIIKERLASRGGN